MNDNNISMVEVKATLVLSDLKKRERLLEIIRGKPRWKLYVSGAVWFIVAAYICKDQNTLLMLLILLIGVIVQTYADFSQRINALIELIGEDNLRQPKMDNQEQTA